MQDTIVGWLVTMQHASFRKLLFDVAFDRRPRIRPQPLQPLAPSASFVRLCIQTHSPLVSRSTLPKFSRRSTSESRQQLQLTQRTAAAQLTACALKSRSLFSYAEFRNGASPLSGGIEPGQSPAPSDSTAVVCADMLILIVCCSASQNVEAKLRLADA